MKTNYKAIVLFSGGLDSILAVKIMQLQNIPVKALTFVSNFYNAEKARLSAKEIQVELHEIDIHGEMLELAKNPPNGYGKNMNPCIDCHSMMLRLAGQYTQKHFKKDYFLATGEVLGQRPFSQTKQALYRVQKIADQEILRPLSAKLLPITKIEKQGIVKRHKLFSIEGRSREKQIELAEKYGIKSYPSPGGGCLLTDPGFSGRLVKMLGYWPDCGTNDVELLKCGRVYWLKNNNKKILVIIGRHQKDNQKLEKLAQTGDFMVELKELNGPFALIRGDNSLKFDAVQIEIPEKFSTINFNQEFDAKKTLKLVGYFANKARGTSQEFIIKQK